MVAANQQYLGKSGTITMDGLQVKVKIIDVKVSYGNERFYITTGVMNESGTANAIWVSADRVTVQGSK